MISPNLSNWEYNSTLEGLLFFAQRAHELLFFTTLDSYKAPALNTYFRCFELESAIEEIEASNLKYGILKPLMEELKYSIENDSIAQEILGSHCYFYLQRLNLQPGNLSDIKTHISNIRNYLSKEYVKMLKEKIILAVQEGKKENIDILTTNLMTQLINEGYHTDDLYHQVQYFFFQIGNKITNCSQIKDFLDRFNFTLKKWEVLFKATPVFSECPSKVTEKFELEISFTTPKYKTTTKAEQEFLSTNEYGLFISIKNIEAFDLHSARYAAEAILKQLANLIRSHSHKKKIEWNKDVLVFNVSENHTAISRHHLPAVYRQPDSTDLGVAVSETFSSILESKIDFESKALLFRFLDLQALALESKSLENQLINFWTSIETITRSVDEESSKISSIVSTISPVLSYKYPVKLVYDLDYHIKKYKKVDALNIISKSPIGENDFNKLSAIIMIDELKDYRMELYSLFDKNPLLKNRIFRLHQQLSSAKTMDKLMKNHHQKIGWHLQRIYRSRNLIVHSGHTLPYLEILVENIHSYVDRIFDVILERFNKKKFLKTIEEAFLDIKFDFESHLQLLSDKRNEKCTADNYKLILYGP